MLYDPERSELVLQQPAFGFDDPERIAAYHVPLRDGGNAVKVFLSGRAYLTNDATGDPRLIRRFVDLFDTRTSLTVPLIVEDQAIGVCHAINKRGGPFTEEDLDLLNLIAPLLAVSVQSAHLFRQVRAQGRQLERAIFLQRELSRTAFDAPGMGPLAERLTDLVNRPVMVLDPALRPLATSRWPEELPPAEHWLDHGQREVWWRRGQDGAAGRCWRRSPWAATSAGTWRSGMAPPRSTRSTPGRSSTPRPSLPWRCCTSGPPTSSSSGSRGTCCGIFRAASTATTGTSTGCWPTSATRSPDRGDSPRCTRAGVGRPAIRAPAGGMRSRYPRRGFTPRCRPSACRSSGPPRLSRGAPVS